MKFYGTAKLRGDSWEIVAEPHVMLRLKRAIPTISKRVVERAKLLNTPEACRDLEWFAERFPITFYPLDVLKAQAATYRDRVQRIADLVGGHVPPPRFDLAFPPREYQATAAAVYLSSGSLLLADDVGLGKTLVAIASFTDPRALPAVVIAPAHLCRQWVREVERFAPALHVHGIKKSEPYKLPAFLTRSPDVLVLSYHKLAGWATTLREYAQSVVFDEVHEMRRPKAQKYEAAMIARERAAYCLGLSATPIYNYGGEVFDVFNVIRPGCLGSKGEFYTAWCKGTTYEADGTAVPAATGGKAILADPRALGTYLRDEGLMLRRTRADVRRELPAVTTIPYAIDSDARILEAVEGKVAELARIVLAQATTPEERTAKLEASGQLDMKLRQATGIAKAAYVGAFVAELVANGEPVVLVGWHRAVYAIWQDVLKREGVRTQLYTGTESIAEKDLAVKDFALGKVDVLILSLRSGLGINGLEQAASVMVFGELDWSPAVHEQCVGRLNRDGQKKPVLAYYLISEHGSDPVVAEVLGVKKAQLHGVRDPGAEVLEVLDRDGDRVKKLARSIRDRRAALAEKVGT